MSLRFSVALIIHLFYNLLRYVVFLTFPYEWIALSFLTNAFFNINFQTYQVSRFCRESRGFHSNLTVSR